MPKPKSANQPGITIFLSEKDLADLDARRLAPAAGRDDVQPLSRSGWVKSLVLRDLHPASAPMPAEPQKKREGGVVPAIRVYLPTAALAVLDARIAARSLPGTKHPTRSTLLGALVRAALRRDRRARAAALREQLRGHPLRPGAGLPHPLQDAALALIAAGERHLVPELLRAGEWENQVAALARRWAQDGLSHEELCAAGMVGFMRAIADWKPGPGWRSYAYLWIKKELERAVRSGGSIVMESEQEMRIRRTVERHARRGLDPAAIAKKTGLSLEQVERGAAGRRALDWKEIDPRRM